MKLFSEVAVGKMAVEIGLKDKIFVLGSCFAESVGERMKAGGFDVHINPFGTLYNPASLAKAIERLDSGEEFTEKDCIEMGAGAGLICSFHHHTAFARSTANEFLTTVNSELEKASKLWKECGKAIITFGTSRVWKHDGEIVSNCLKRPEKEFTSELISVDEVESMVSRIISSHPDKHFIFTVSPIRHLGRGAHDNTLSKATLQLGVEVALKKAPQAAYFPSYEIFLDELRDYRFCSADLAHPSDTAIEYIWEKFLASAVPASEIPAIRANEKIHRQSRHRTILK